MKKLINLLFVLCLSFKTNLVLASKEDIVSEFDTILDIRGGSGTSMIDRIVNAFIGNMFALLALVVITIFIYVGFLFITSSGDPAQFKKAWKILVYTVIGMVVILLSFGVVKLVSSIGI